MHDDDAVGDLLDGAEIVRDEQARKPIALLQLADQLQDLLLHRHVERGHRLVGDHEGRPPCDGAGDGHALALAAGELMR
jgi:hypothetical protein